MKKNIHVIASGFGFLYLWVLIFVPLFHFHMDTDHQNVRGDKYHSHSLPFDTPPSEHGEAELPPGDELQLLQIVPQLNRIQSSTFENRTLLAVFHFWLNKETPSPQDRNNFTSRKNHFLNILSPQWDNYILYATSISPPRT